MKFGILNDIMGAVETVPHIKLSRAFMTGDSSWVTYRNGALRRLRGRGLEFTDANNDQVQMPDANPIMHWHYHRDTNGIDYVFAYTKDHVYQWDGTDTWDLMFTCSSSCTHWSSASAGGKIISTNNVDLVQVWDETTPGVAFADLGSASGIDIGGGLYLTRAAYVIVYESYVFLLNTYENGVQYKYRRCWCSRGDPSDWDRTGSGDAGSHNLEAGLTITGAGIYDSPASASLLITFTNKNQNAMVLVTDDIVFSSDDILNSTGCLAADSIVNDAEGNLYYLATDWTIRRVFDERSLSKAVDITIKGLHKTLYTGIRASYIDSLNQIWWAAPKDAASVQNDKVLRLNLDTFGWEPDLDVSISAFGKYARQSTPNIDDVDEIIDEYDHIIDAVENTEGWLFPLVGSYDGYAYSVATSTTDKGNSYMGRGVVATDLSDGKYLNEYKRTHGANFWLEAEAVATYSVDVTIRRAGQADFESLGSINIYGTGKLIEKWLPFDQRFKACEIAISGQNPFALCGIVFDFSLDGDR